MDLIAFLTSLGDASVRAAVPLVIATLGGVIAERSGIFNIGIEGMMLSGAFGGIVGSFWAMTVGLPNVVAATIGLLLATVTSSAIAWIHGFLVITNRADQIISGVAINLLALGLTSLLYRQLSASIGGVRVPGLERIAIPGLSDIPVVGPIFFRQSVIVYLIYFVPFVMAVILRRSPLGLALRATGDFAEGADAAGISVRRIRYGSIIFGGAMAGLAGATLALGGVRLFTPDMTAGRGFIVLAAIVVARWNPKLVIPACLIFGVADAFQLRAQALGVGIPSPFLLMLPYVLTVLVMATPLGKSSAPLQLGTRFSRE